MSNEMKDWKRDELIEQLIKLNLTDALKYIAWLERQYYILSSDKERLQKIATHWHKG